MPHFDTLAAARQAGFRIFIGEPAAMKKSNVKVDIMCREDDAQAGFLTALLTTETGREVVLFADDEPACDRSRAEAERFAEDARAEADNLGAGFTVEFDLDDEFE